MSIPENCYSFLKVFFKYTVSQNFRELLKSRPVDTFLEKQAHSYYRTFSHIYKRNCD